MANDYTYGTTHYANRKVRAARHVVGCRKRGTPTCGGSFKCATCGKLVGWCHGAYDEHPDDCDWCANKKLYG